MNATLLRGLLCLLLLGISSGILLVGTPAQAVTKDWVAAEGETIINGKSSGSTTADAPGEVSLQWRNASGGLSFESPDETADTVVDHLSDVSLVPENTSLRLAPGDTLDVGITVVNSGNGPDSYSLAGDTSWLGDTTVFLDTDRDSTSLGEPTISQVGTLTALGTSGDDTGVVLRFKLPDTATIGSSTAYRFSAESIRDADSEPGYDSVAFILTVSDSVKLTIDYPSDNHDTNVRRITVSGTTNADPGDSVVLTVDGMDTMVTTVSDSDDWSLSDVPLNGMDDTIRSVVHVGDSTTSITGSDTITVNFDITADTFPQNFTVDNIGLTSVDLSWNAFGSDPDTGTGFAEYRIYYDTNTIPDSTSPRWTIGDDSGLNDLTSETTTITGLTSSDTYAFRIGYVDQVGNVSTLSPAVVTLTDTIPADVNLIRFETITMDTAVLADGSGTFGIAATWKNVGGQPGRVTVDTGDIDFVNFNEEKVNDFDVTLLSDSTGVIVPGGDTRQVIWSVTVPDTDQSMLQGQFRVHYDTSIPPTTVNISRLVSDVTTAQGGIDAWTATSQLMDFQVGKENNHLVHDTDLVTDADSIVMMVQRGDTSFLDTPVINPDYGFETEEEFDRAISSANKAFDTSVGVFLSNKLINVSIWKGGVGQTYIGNKLELFEDVTVSMRKPAGAPEDLLIAKLIPSTGKWHIIDENPSVSNSTITFQVPSDDDVTGAGFSIFRILIDAGIDTDGSASQTIVYPNPFIPFDGQEKTGEYGFGPDQGIFFAAGDDVGFPAGTYLAIYTVSGNRVFQKRTTQGGIIRWNPKTRSGEPVASGVYIYRITTPDGSEKVGKLSIIR